MVRKPNCESVRVVFAFGHCFVLAFPIDFFIRAPAHRQFLHLPNSEFISFRRDAQIDSLIVRDRLPPDFEHWTRFVAPFGL